MLDEVNLLKTLITASWINVKAMTTPAHRDPLLDVVFDTAERPIRLTGKAHSLQGAADEAFSLAIYEHVERGWWAKEGSEPVKWEPRNLSDEWAPRSLSSLLRAPRGVSFYRDARLGERQFPAERILDACTAIEFVAGNGERRDKAIVFRASETYPCELEMGVTPEACARLLDGLSRVELGT